MWQLRRFLKPYWKFAVLAPIFMILEVYFDLLQPKLMADIVNHGVVENNLQLIKTTGAMMIGVALLGLLTGVLCNVFAGIVSQSFGANIRAALFQKVQSFSFRNLDQFKTGSLITRMTSDIMQLQTLAQMSMQSLVRGFMLALGSLIMTVTISPRLGLIVLIAMPVLVLVLTVLLRYTSPLFALVQKRLDAVNIVLQENLAGIRVVKAFVRTDFETKRFGKVNQEHTGMAMKAARTVALNMPIMTLIMNASVVAVLWFGGHQVWEGSMPLGDLIAFLNYVTQALMALLNISMNLVTIAQAKVSADRVNQVLQAEPDIVSPAEKKQPAARAGRVEFDHVSFSYGTANQHEMVLQDVNFVAAPGQTIAIIGSTGAGKSTLVNLIPRLYDVTSGRVLIDGINVKDMELHDLRQGIGMVLQQSILFTGSIRDNIRFGKPDATQEEVEIVAKAAQAHDFIVKMPDGYDTDLGQKGVNLSGGQKQRLAIARALLVRPPILVLDDNTSALDAETEARLQEALQELMKSSTTLLIAQRISSVKDADQILVVEEGRIVSRGTHQELLASCSVYQAIYHSQHGKEAKLHG